MHTVTWCENHGHPVIELDAAGEIALRDVDNLPVAPYWTDATRFTVIPEASVMAGWDFVMTAAGGALDYNPPSVESTGNLMGAYTFVPSVANRARSRIFHPWTKDVTVIDADALFLGAPPAYHYGHWIYDFLSRLRAWRQAGRAPLKIFTLAGLPQAHRQTLTMFGVQPEDLIEGEIGRVYRFRSLTVGVPLSHTLPVPATARFLYEALAVQKTPAAAGGGCFLERSQTARGRAIVNAEELAAVLSEFQIRTVRRPELSVFEQNALFSEAGIIITPFGTDLVTMFQVRPGTDIVALQFPDMENVYEGIADLIVRYCAILGMRLHIVECSLAVREGKLKYHGDMIVDCVALRGILGKIQARRQAEEARATAS